MGMKCLLKNFSKMALILIPQHNVYQIHIKQVLLMIVLMVFEERGEEYDVLIIILKLCGIVLLQHRIQGNVMQYEIYIYYVHAVMHEQQLKFDIIKRIVKYELKVLKMNKIVQSLHIITTELWFDIKKRKKENNNCKTSNSNDNNRKQDDNFETVLLVLTPRHNVHEPHMIHFFWVILVVFVFSLLFLLLFCLCCFFVSFIFYLSLYILNQFTFQHCPLNVRFLFVLILSNSHWYFL